MIERQPDTPPDYAMGERIEAEQQLSSGVSWFYWIAALSLINTLISFTGSQWGFGLGLGITQLFDAIAGELEGGLKFIPIVMSLTATAAFAVFGFLGNKQQTWAILLGMVLYLLDGLLLVLLAVFFGGLPIISLLIHAYALYQLFMGFSACRRLKELGTETMSSSFQSPPPPPQSF